MATQAEERRKRKAGLRQVRRTQRTFDTAIEKLERRIFRLLDRKTLITIESASDLTDLYEDVLRAQRQFEADLAAFLTLAGDSG